MDVLDLSLGEKKSRRKTQAPQRRQQDQNSNFSTEDKETIDTDSSDVSENENNSRQEDAVKLDAGDRVKIDLGINSAFLKQEAFRGSHSVSGESNLVVSPYSSNSDAEDKELCGTIQEPKKSPSSCGSSSTSQSIALIHPPKDFYAKEFNNNNSNNNNSINHLNFAQLQQLPGTMIPSLPKTNKEIADLSELRERYSRLTSKMSPSLLPPSHKTSSSLSFSSFDVQPIDTPGIPERTKKQNRWAFNVWREWARKRNIAGSSSPGNAGKVPLDVGKATEVELDFWLSKFVQEIRRKDGNPYPPHTLMQIVMGIQRYLRQQAGRPSICILDRSNPVYSRFRTVLDARIKELTSEGVSATHKSSRSRSTPSGSLSNSHGSNSYSASNSTNYPEQAVLWNAGVIGDETALSLLNAVFYHSTVTFGIRNIDDHWNLKMSHFVLGNRGQQGQAFVEFVPSRDSTFVNRSMAKDRRVYAEPGNPRCVVKIFQKYMSLVPPEGPFYRHPQEPTLVDRSIRFSDQWVGKNRLRAMIKHVFDSTRLDGRERSQGALNTGSSPQNSGRFSTNQNVAASENPINPSSVYDRLAQVMWHLSYMRSSPQVQTSTNSNPSPVNPSTPSPKPEITGYEPSPPPPISHPQPVPGRNEIVLKRESSPDSLLEAPQPKRFRPFLGASVSEASAKDEADDVKVTSSCEKPIDENALEIAVPRNIESVVVVKGTKRYTVHLE